MPSYCGIFPLQDNPNKQSKNLKLYFETTHTCVPATITCAIELAHTEW